MWRVRGGTLTSIDGYDSEILSACEMEPSKEAAKRGRKKMEEHGIISTHDSDSQVRVIISDISIHVNMCMFVCCPSSLLHNIQKQHSLAARAFA